MKKSYLSLLLIASVALPVAAFASGSSHWGYEGKEGPEHWAELSHDFSMCGEGKFQSPIDINETITGKLAQIKTNYNDAELEILNNGHTIQVNYPKGSNMVVDGVKYNLLQFHFHTPSENTIAGKKFPMELHFVHATDDGKLGVLGVMIDEGKENKELAKIWAHLPTHKTAANKINGVKINGKNLLPNKSEYYRFSGSLTTPPCSEGVNWHVMANPISASKAQIDAFKKVFSMNARPVQQAAPRLIVKDK